MTKIAELLRKHMNESPHGEQARIVRMLDINKSTMTKWLSGKASPNCEHTLTIVEFLKQKKENTEPK